MKAWSADSLLRDYYKSAYRPFIVRRLHRKTVGFYDSALRRFERFTGGRPRLGGVSHQLLMEFKRWLPSKKCGEKLATNLAGAIRKIVQSWTGENFVRVVPLPPPESGTLRHYSEEHYIASAMLNCKSASLEDTRRAVRSLHDYCGGDIPLGDLSDKLIAAWLQKLIDRGKATPTVNRYRATLLAVWNHAFRASAIERGPRVKRLREVKNPPEAWSLDEMKKLLAAARRFRTAEYYGPFQCNLWWTAILHVAYDTGLRRATLLAIRQRDIDLNSGWLLVDGSTTKTLKGQSFKLSRESIAALKEIWRPERDRVFVGASGTAVNGHFGLLLKSAGIRKSRRRGLGKFHMLRRTTATLVAARAGISAASAILGHSDIEVTRRYLDPTQLRHDATTILPSLDSDADTW